jgi:hypothetical protein
MSETPASRAAALGYELHVKTVLARFKHPVHDSVLGALREFMVKTRAQGISPQECAFVILTTMSRREDSTLKAGDGAMRSALRELNDTWPSDGAGRRGETS